VTAPSDEQHYAAALRRIYRSLLVVSAAGITVAFAWKGWRAGAGFTAGAVASAVSFRWLHRLVDSVGEPGNPRPKGRLAWLFGFRYLIFGAAAYAIVRYFGISAGAVVCGLLVVVAAVLIEIVFELITYART
jgi:hypothetical protein